MHIVLYFNIILGGVLGVYLTLFFCFFLLDFMGVFCFFLHSSFIIIIITV